MKNFSKFNDVAGAAGVMTATKRKGQQQPAAPAKPDDNGFRQRSLPTPK
jgi:hypothetical protein